MSDLTHYNLELRVAAELAQAAGAVILEYYDKPLRVRLKSTDDDPVTEADQAANELIVKQLHDAFPDDAVLSEESVDTTQRLSRRRVWIVDPLDGTKGFIAGNKEFAVQIGLAVDGKSVLGVVYQPATDDLHWGVAGLGAWSTRSGDSPARLRVSSETEPERMRLAASRAHRPPEMDRVVRALGVMEEVRQDSIGVKLGLIARQRCDLYIELSSGTKQWDTCAPEVILQEAGGRLTDLRGNPLCYNAVDVHNRHGVIASNGMAHASIIKKLEELFERA